MQASKEVWGKIFGTINTREKFQKKRGELAAREWARFKANDSLECRNCHSEESMDFTRQSKRASDAHQRFLVTKQRTCIDCHKGIAHELPDAHAASMQEIDANAVGMIADQAELREYLTE
jgi:cytochrome c-type protein NapC